MRTATSIAVCICALLLVLPAAAAKDGVRAKLEAGSHLGAAPGTTIPIRWRLVDANGRAFGASGIYLRISRCGGGLRRVKARDLGGGRFSARVVVPEGGIRRLRVGLEGWRIPAGGTARRADMIFEFDPPIARRCDARAGARRG